MARQRHTAEEIINKLREPEVGLAKGMAVPEVCRKLGVTEQTCYRWRKEYGGLTRGQAKRLRELEQENARLGVWLLALSSVILAVGIVEAAIALLMLATRPSWRTAGT